MNDFASNIQAIRKRIADAAAIANSRPDDITIIAVSKMKPRADVEMALKAGHNVFGENKVQEAESKFNPPLPGAELHMIGHLQSNKTRNAAALFDWIHTLDKKKTINRLDKHLGEAGRSMGALLQVDIAGEAQKSGASAEDLPELIEHCASCEHLKLHGLMIIPPFEKDPEQSRRWFSNLRRLRDSLEKQTGIPLPQLSMGMSSDFHIAIEEGATMVRIGTAIFGERDYGNG